MYKPNPIDTTKITLSDDSIALKESFYNIVEESDVEGKGI
jgi:hypothetical protein